MKKIYSLLIISLFVGLQCFGQQYINLYQDDVLINQLSTEEIDSMSITETEPHIINFWYDGKIFLSYNSAGIDSITITNKGGAPFSYAGIVGFNSELKTKGLGILSPSTKSQYESFVNNLSCKDGTILYYAVNRVLNILDKANIETPLQSAHVITFTDGLDQGSLMLTDKYASSVEYLNALSERIPQTQLSGLSPQFYSVGLRGSDVSNIELFRQNLKLLASSDANAFEVNDISDLRSKFNNIANQIISVSTRQAVSVKVPGVENGTRMRFVFDNKTAENSQLYIEGTFNLQDRCLHDVVYQGIKAVSGKTVQGTQDGIFLTYTFTGMRPVSGTSLIPTSSVKHYNKYPSSTSWQINSEFSPASSSQQNVSHSGTAIFLIVDCSNSLKSQFSLIQQYAKEFLNLIANNAEPFELLAPKNVKAVLDDNRLVTNVSWDAVEYAQSYEVYRSSTSNGTYTLLADGVTTNSWTDENPLQGTNYYKVCAVGYGQMSSRSSYASVSVSLATPTNVKAVLDDNRLVTNVSWDAVKYAQSYEVYRSSTSNGTYTLLADGVTTNSWTDENPLQGTNYYKVCAVGYGQMSSRSSYASVSVSLATPTNVKAVLDDNRLVTNISWDAVKYAQSYNVYRSSSENGTYTLMADSVINNSWIDENPLQVTNYYKVCAFGYGQMSSRSSYASASVYLATPTNVKAELDSLDNRLVTNVSWDAVKYAQSYEVYRSSTSNGTYTLLADGVTTNSWTDENPLMGNYYKVCAFGYGQMSSRSSYASASVYLATPTNVKAELDSLDNRLVTNVSWDAVKYAQSYEVYRSSTSNGTYTLLADGVTTNSWTDENPLQGTNYYKVCAVGYGQISSRSSYASVNIPSLASPTNVKAELDSLDDRYVVNVSWDVVKFAQCYKVYRSSTSNGTYTLVEDGITDNAWTDKSPLGGNNYYKVSAVGYGQISSQSSYAYLSVYLATPTNVKAELDDKDLFVNVSWDVVKFAQCYKVYRSYHESGTYALVADNITDNSWTDKNPLNGISFYKISAEGYGMMSSQSNYCWVQCYDTSKDTPEYVDLGLPSGLKWADRNIGASNPEDYGVYFAQGETEPKTDYSWNTYKWGSSKDLLTKYCTNSSYGLNGFTDNKTSLDLEDDAAHMNWSGEWRMPTKADFEELINNTNLERVTNYKGTGVAGFLFTASNGNHIFLPAAGDYNTSKLFFAGSAGYYWSSSLNTRFPYVAYSLLLTSDKVSVANYFSREIGRPVRPVRF